MFNGNIIFRREVLENRFGQEAEIPAVFRMGKLKDPPRDDVQRWLENRLENAKRKRAQGGRAGMKFGFGYQEPADDESEESDYDVDQELKKLDARQRGFQ